MLHLGKIELLNNLLLIYLKSTRLEAILSIFTTNKTISIKQRNRLKKYLVILRKFIESENLPCQSELMAVNYNESNVFFKEIRMKKESAENINCILFKISEIYVEFFRTLQIAANPIKYANGIPVNNLSLGLDALRDTKANVPTSVMVALTIIKDIEGIFVEVPKKSEDTLVISNKGEAVLKAATACLDDENAVETITKLLMDSMNT